MIALKHFAPEIWISLAVFRQVKLKTGEIQLQQLRKSNRGRTTWVPVPMIDEEDLDKPNLNW